MMPGADSVIVPSRSRMTVSYRMENPPNGGEIIYAMKRAFHPYRLRENFRGGDKGENGFYSTRRPQENTRL